MTDLEQTLYAKGYRIRTVNGREEWYKADPVLQSPELKPDTSDEPVAENPGEDHRAGFRHVRITSYRVRLVDERNLWDKYVVDALVKAGLLRDDSPQWCKVEVFQRLVYSKADELTEVLITESCRTPETSDTPPPAPCSP